MFRHEFFKIIGKLKFWIMAFMIGLTKFAAVFTLDGNEFNLIFIEKCKTKCIMTLELGNTWLSDITFCIMCFVAYAVSDCIIDDIENKRLNDIFSRCGLLKYSFSKVQAIFLASFICMAVGQFIFVGVSVITTHMSLFPIPETADFINYGFQDYSDLLKDGRYLEGYLLRCSVFVLFGCFITLITAIFSLYIKDKKFIIVLSVVIMYFILYVFGDNQVTIFTGWLNPRAVFTYGNWMNLKGVPYAMNDIAPVLYALAYTLIISVVLFCLLYRKLDRWKINGKI